MPLFGNRKPTETRTAIICAMLIESDVEHYRERWGGSENQELSSDAIFADMVPSSSRSAMGLSGSAFEQYRVKPEIRAQADAMGKHKLLGAYVAMLNKREWSRPIFEEIENGTLKVYAPVWQSPPPVSLSGGSRMVVIGTFANDKVPEGLVEVSKKEWQ